MQEYLIKITDADGKNTTTIRTSAGQKVAITTGPPDLEPLQPIQDQARELLVRGIEEDNIITAITKHVPAEILPSGTSILKALVQYASTGTIDIDLITKEMLPKVTDYTGGDTVKLLELVNNLAGVMPKIKHVMSVANFAFDAAETNTVAAAEASLPPVIDSLAALNEGSLQQSVLLKHFTKSQLASVPVTIENVRLEGKTVRWSGNKDRKEVYHVSTYDEQGRFLGMDQSSDEVDTKSVKTAGGPDKVYYIWVLHLKKSRGEISHSDTSGILGRSVFTKVK